jgi:hypothetical protein
LDAQTSRDLGCAFDAAFIDFRNNRAHEPETGFRERDENDAALHHAKRADFARRAATRDRRFGEIVPQGVEQNLRIMLPREKDDDVLKNLAGKLGARGGYGFTRR